MTRIRQFVKFEVSDTPRGVSYKSESTDTPRGVSDTDGGVSGEYRGCTSIRYVIPKYFGVSVQPRLYVMNHQTDSHIVTITGLVVDDYGLDEILDMFQVSNRRERRWLNDRLLMDLVPRLDVEEIRGLFAPPPWGDDVPLSAFCMTNVGAWDKFRTVDMDKEVGMIDALKSSIPKKNGRLNTDKIAVLNAWHRVDCRTREALRRSFLSELLDGYEKRVLEFLNETCEEDVLMLSVQDPFHRLLLHGVCEYYDLVSTTVAQTNAAEPMKMTKIKKKKAGSCNFPNITLTHFLKMSKEGAW